jgi:hypothetical protein
MENKASATNEIADELTFHRPHPSRYISMAKDDAENLPNAEVFRCSQGHANIAEGETNPSSELHQQIKFILQDCQTGKFMRCDSMWSDDINEALDFLSARRAVFFGMKELTAEFHILQIGCSGLRSTATIKLGLLKWTEASPAAHFVEGVRPKSKPYPRLSAPHQDSALDYTFSEKHKTFRGTLYQFQSKQTAFYTQRLK